MVDDWEDAFQLKMHEEKEKEIAFRKDALERRLRSNLKDSPEYIRQNRVDKDEFLDVYKRQLQTASRYIFLMTFVLRPKFHLPFATSAARAVSTLQPATTPENRCV